MTNKLPFPVFRFKPRTTSKIPGASIIVLQEWWGVNNQCKQHAQRLADDTGAHTVIPDLYKGKVGVDAEEASHLMKNLDWRNAISELQQLTLQLHEAKYPSVGSIGFCMGGGLSLALASHLATASKYPLKACVSCYGTPPGDLYDVRDITTVTPVQGHFGGKDTMKGFSDPEAADALEFNLRIHKTAESIIYRYPEQGHAFMNDEEWSIEQRKNLGFVDKTSDPKVTEQQVRELAWSRINSFFVQHLSNRQQSVESLDKPLG
ncbi:dienelactone hydrolase [Halteromyces radiatus]|uniref:dienelactone hydrolase n=1 Tax=Halteromyces radiatus TaxID=101107 RepID=UPI002220131B|nr:dienelactone hydrolase [Halteromyces radiatus]KAI8081278.1 dienelactone hydrolase [Halteromyces radiatus]